MVVHQEPISCCNEQLNSIEAIGVTTLVFFEFMRQMALLMFSNFVIYGIYSLATDISEQRFSSMHSGCLDSNSCPFVRLIGIASKVTPADGQASKFLIAQAWLGMAMTFLWIGQLLYSRNRFRFISDVIDERLTTASDFTAQLYNLPRDVGYTDEEVIEELKEWCKRRQLNLEVLKVSIAFEIEELSSSIRGLEEVQRKIRKHDLATRKAIEKSKLSVEQVTALKKEEADLILKIGQLSEQSEETLRPGLYAFVTFRTRAMLFEFLRASKRSALEVLLLWLANLCCEDAKVFESSLTIKGKNIYTKRAPEPSDVTWENAGVSRATVVRNQVMSYVVSLLFLGASFGIIYGLSVAQAELGSHNFYVSVLVSVVITVVNISLKILVKYFTEYEKHITKTDFNESLAIKTTVVQLINSILVLVIVGWFIKQKIQHINVFDTSGLIDDTFMVAVTTSFLPFALAFFVDPEQIFHHFYRWRRGAEIEAGECLLTQRELNLELEHSHFYVSMEYVSVNMIVLYNAFFAALQPVSLLFGGVGLVLLYFVKKYLLLNRYTRPPQLGKSLNASMASMMDLAPFFFAFGSLMVMNLLVREGVVLVPNLIAVGVAALYFLLPVDTFLHSCCKDSFENDFTQDYYDCRVLLFEEYDRSNPVSRNSASREWAQFLESKSSTEEERLFAKGLFNNYSQAAGQNELVHNLYSSNALADEMGGELLSLGEQKYADNNPLLRLNRQANRQAPPPGMNSGNMAAHMMMQGRRGGMPMQYSPFMYRQFQRQK